MDNNDARRKDALVNLLTSRRNTARIRIKAFQDDLGGNPAHALEWSLDTFTAAAKMKVITVALNLLEKAGFDGSLQALHSVASSRVLSAARNPKRSTSPISNVMYQEELAEWAELEEMVKGAIEAKL